MNNPYDKRERDTKHNNKSFNSETQSIKQYLKELSKDNLADMINKNADVIAKIIMQGSNSYTQVRKFYDELLSLQKQAQENTKNAEIGAFEKVLPMIYLVKSKAAYAKGKKNINDNLLDFLVFYIEKIENIEQLKYFMLYFEAILGYLRLYSK